MFSHKVRQPVLKGGAARVPIGKGLEKMSAKRYGLRTQGTLLTGNYPDFSGSKIAAPDVDKKNATGDAVPEDVQTQVVGAVSSTLLRMLAGEHVVFGVRH